MNTNGIDTGKPGGLGNRLLNCRTGRGPLVRNQSRKVVSGEKRSQAARPARTGKSLLRKGGPWMGRAGIALAGGLVWLLLGVYHQGAERYVAIDNVCAWPNLTLMPDGSVVATIFNRPYHGLGIGDVECWSSRDGRLWERRGSPAVHEGESNRMNVAAGLAHDGSLVVLASGWGGRDFRERILPTLVARSSDGGRSWSRSSAVQLPQEVDFLIPFGDIVQGEGKLLAASFYHEIPGTANAYLLFSRDDGRSWGEAVKLAPHDYNETALLRLRPDRWLAASRSHADGHLALFVSEDEGKHWARSGLLTLPGHHPAHLLRMADGRVLLTYGIREKGHHGIGYRTSEDEGQSWSRPTRIVNLEETTDGGYPSTVQMADGTLLTAYYSNRVPQHQRYHMGVVRWVLEKE